MADSFSYDGFISYSHAADGLLAPRLQAGLQRFAKPWWKRRALRLFRDESSLSANPHLWSSITEALDQSGWFVLLLSPAAAGSEWVGQEIEYWTANRDPSRILPVVTDGEFGWSDGDVVGGAVPDALQGVFSEEPRWVDLRWAKDEDQLDLQDPRFADAVADIGSALRGVPKDELASEEVRQHRRTVRTAWVGGVALAALAVLAGALAIQSSNNAAEAERQAEVAAANAAEAEANAEAEAVARAEAEASAAAEADARSLADANAALARARELASSAIANLESQPELATLLALVALDAAPETDDPPVELVNAIWRAGSSNRLVDVIETGYDGDVSLSADGTRLAVTVAPTVLRMYDAHTQEVLWEYSEDTVDHFEFPVIGPDGRTALPIVDSSAERGRPVDSDDGLPNRVVVLDSAGRREATLEFPDCRDVNNSDWSPDSRFLAIGYESGCVRNGAAQWIEVFDTVRWQSAAFLTTDGVGSNGPAPRFDSRGTLFALRAFEPAVIFDGRTFEQIGVSEATGIGDVTPSGARILGTYTDHGSSARGGTPFSVLSFDRTSGAIADILYTGIRYPSSPFGVTATEDGRYVIVATEGASTFVYDPLTGEERLRLSTGPVDTYGYDSERQILFTDGSELGPRVWDLSASTSGVARTGDLGEYSWVNGNGFEVGNGVGAFAQIDVAGGRWQTGLFDVATGVLYPPVPGTFPRATLANGNLLLSISNESEERSAIYDLEAGELKPFLTCEEFDAEEGSCVDLGYNIATSVDGSEIRAYPWMADGTTASESLHVDISTGEVSGPEPIDHESLVVFTFTDSWILGSPTSRIDYRVLDRETGAVLWQDELGHISHEVSASGRWIVTRGVASAELVDTESWTGQILGGLNNLRGMAFNESETLLALMDADSVRVLDIESGLVAQQVILPGVSDLHFIDDEMVVLGTKDGLWGTLSLSTDELLARTREGVRRTFTDQECVTYRIDPCPSLEEFRGG